MFVFDEFKMISKYNKNRENILVIFTRFENYWQKEYFIVFSSKTMNVLINRTNRLCDFCAFQKSLNEDKHCFFLIEDDKNDVD